MATVAKSLLADAAAEAVIIVVADADEVAEVADDAVITSPIRRR